MVVLDIDQMYPQQEPKFVQRCDSYNCLEDLVEKQEVVEHAGYLYCDSQCLLDQMYKEGNANKVIAGE